MKTTCAYCGVGCGIRLSREGDNWQLQGDEQHPANGGALCVKGASLLESLAFPDRLLYPRWMGQRIGWEEALDTWRSVLPPSWPSPGRVPSASICRASSPPRITTSPTS